MIFEGLDSSLGVVGSMVRRRYELDFDFMLFHGGDVGPASGHGVVGIFNMRDEGAVGFGTLVDC